MLVRIILYLPLQPQCHFFLCLLGNDARFQASEGEEPEVVVIMKQIALRQQLRVHHDRNPDFQPQPRLAPLKHRRRYADNRVRVLINFDRLAHDLWIAAEMRLPQPVADHRDRSASRRVVL